MGTEFVAPDPGEGAFTCPHCGAYAPQSWSAIRYYRHDRPVRSRRMAVSICERCRQYAIWRRRIDHTILP